MSDLSHADTLEPNVEGNACQTIWIFLFKRNTRK
jgi:hypothetical protein